MQKPDVSSRMLWKWPLQAWWQFVNVGALGIGSAFFVSILFTYNWSEDPLFWRVFSPKNISIGPGDHHALIMLLFGVMFFSVVKLKVNPLVTTLGIFLYVEAYEAEWYLTYIAARNFYGGPFQWSWMLIAVNTIPAVAAYIAVFGVPWRFLGFMVPMFAAWFFIGFPITNDFPARTVYFYSLQVNALEILTHVYAAVGFYLFAYPRLKKGSDSIRMKWWVH